MKRVLCIIDTLDYGGGAERQMAGLAGMLHKRGYDVILTTYHKHDMNPWLREKYGMESIILNCEASQWSKFKTVRRFIKNGNFDTVIAYKDGATMIACLCRMTGLKFKLIVSERNTSTVFNSYEKRKFFLYRFADLVVPNSYSQGRFIKERIKHLSKKVHVITNFTDLEDFTPGYNPPTRDDVIHILIIARIAPQKNIIPFMRVVERLKGDKINVRFDWYGGVYFGMEEYGKEVMNEYERLGISDYLQFHEPTNAISEKYKECDAFCLPSLYEGYPNVVCEAMSSGKPILCSRVCDNPDIVEESRNGMMFNPTDEDEMYVVLKTFCNKSKGELFSMGRESRAIAEQKFSANAFVDEYIQIM